MDISNAQLRQFLSNYFDGDELHDLCFDYFPRVQQEFTSGMAKSDQIRLLLTHCHNHGERERLIGALRESRTQLFRDEFELTQPEPVSASVVSASPSRNSRQIFISHAYEDSQLAHRLANDLEQHGWQVWIAPDSIQPGEKWVAAINRGLAESGVFLLLISEQAAQSQWVNSETNIAIQWEHEAKVRFIPLQVDSRSLAEIPPFWQTYQFIPFGEDYQSGFAQLLARLEERPHTPLPPISPTKQSLLNRLQQIPNFAWVGIVIVLAVVIVWAVLRGSGGDNSPTAEVQPTEAAKEIVEVATTPNQLTTPAEVIETPVITATQEATATPTVKPSQTPNPPTPTNPPQPATISTLDFPPNNATLGDKWARPQDNMTMVFVPNGTFTMGIDPDKFPEAYSDEQPPHKVTLNEFWLDQTEVTNAQFGQFVKATNYETTAELEGTGSIFVASTWEETANIDWQHLNGPNSDLSELENHPVVLVSWEDANAYCEWAGGSLPTEAQWEYAAQGKNDWLYPWGSGFDGSQVNFCDINCDAEWKLTSVNDGYAHTAPVGTYSGDSWVEAQDMSGNVWEWVADWYGSYSASPAENPTGPVSGTVKVLRGGSWGSDPNFGRSDLRNYEAPDNRIDTTGFRCAISPDN